MFIVKIQGGLGNQLFQYAIGLELSKNNECEFYLDTKWFENKNNDTSRNFMLDKFKINYKIATDYQINKFINHSSLFNKIIDRAKNYFYPLKFRKYIFEIENNFEPKILQLKDNFYLDGTWMNENYFISVANDVRKLYTNRPQLNNYYEQIENLINTTNSVCVHIRRGDYANNPNTLKYHGLTSLEYYENTISFMSKKIDNPQFYFFSDDIDWVKINFKNTPNSIFVSSEFNESDLQEFYLMTICKNQIIANSTFSWWAAWLNSNPSKLICAPKRWSSVVLDSKCLIPDNWIVFNS